MTSCCGAATSTPGAHRRTETWAFCVLLRPSYVNAGRARPRGGLPLPSSRAMQRAPPERRRGRTRPAAWGMGQRPEWRPRQRSAMAARTMRCSGVSASAISASEVTTRSEARSISPSSAARMRASSARSTAGCVGAETIALRFSSCCERNAMRSSIVTCRTDFTRARCSSVASTRSSTHSAMKSARSFINAGSCMPCL